jgi:hypothetical protein
VAQQKTTVVINLNTSGGQTIVSAVTTPGNEIIRVLAYHLTFGGTVTAKFQSHALPTDLTGPLQGVAGSQAISPPVHTSEGRMAPLFETLPGEALDLNLSGNVQVSGWLIYEVP